eukprot:6200937-Pleurochrysis_carterae.AAC.1
MDQAGVDGLHLIFLNVFKLLFDYTLHQDFPVKTLKLVKAYLTKVGFYSYDAAADDENRVSRWIGREAKRFLATADIHLPFSLRVATAPAELMADGWEQAVGVDGSVHVEADDKLALSGDESDDTEGSSKKEAEPTTAEHAYCMWDNFLRLVRCTQKEWAPPHKDFDAYRKERAVVYFNLANAMALDLLKLNPNLAGWVPHVMTLIVPRQILTLGDPLRRSCYAFESFGVACKHIIKKLTCQRHHTATYTRGYIETAFKRACVAASLIDGESNLRYLQRNDASLMSTGRTAKGKLPKSSSAPLPLAPMSIIDVIEAPLSLVCFLRWIRRRPILG